jgi:hypothetical protein
MKVLFVHQNFPGQYLHVARHLDSLPGNEVVFITQRTDADLPGVEKHVYKPARKITRGVPHYLRETEAGVLNATKRSSRRNGVKRVGIYSRCDVGAQRLRGIVVFEGSIS